MENKILEEVDENHLYMLTSAYRYKKLALDFFISICEDLNLSSNSIDRNNDSLYFKYKDNLVTISQCCHELIIRTADNYITPAYINLKKIEKKEENKEDLLRIFYNNLFLLKDKVNR